MTPKISLVVIPVLAGLALVPAAWGNHQYGDAAYQAESSVPQSNLRAVLASDSVESAISAREQVVASQPFNLRDVLASDSAESALAAKASSLAFPERRLVGDNYRDVSKPVSRPTTIAASDSGREIEWPQIGMGFGLGVLLALGLVVAMRYTRIRPLAH